MRAVGKGKSPKAKAGAKSAMQDAPGASSATAGKGKGGMKRKGMSR